MGINFDDLPSEVQKQVTEKLGAKTTKEMRVSASSKVLSVLVDSNLSLAEQIKALEQVIKWLRRVR